MKSNKETLDEVANKQWGNVNRTGVLGFIEGAEWQSKTMYSEEEVFNICRVFATFVMRTGPSYKKQQEWFEQFKKKQNYYETNSSRMVI